MRTLFLGVNNGFFGWFSKSPRLKWVRMCWKLSINSKLSHGNPGSVGILRTSSPTPTPHPSWNRPGDWRNSRNDSEGLRAGDEWKQQRLRMCSCGCRGWQDPAQGPHCHSVPWQLQGKDYPLLPALQSRTKIAFGSGDKPGRGVIHARRPFLIILTRQNDIKDLY